MKSFYKVHFVSDSLSIYSYLNTIYFSSFDNVYSLKIKSSFLKGIFSHLSVFRRLFRFDVYSSCLHESIFLFAFGGTVYAFDLNSKKIIATFSDFKGHGPLNFCSIKRSANFISGVYFGEYYGNSEKEPVNVFYYDPGINEFKILDNFNDGCINHIHSINHDSKSDVLYFLTGDFDSSPGFYFKKSINDDFHVLVSGEQLYRACNVFFRDGNLIYATDSQIEENYIVSIENNSKVKKMHSINGSSIYSLELQDYYVFTTATEPALPIKNSFFTLFENRCAPVIKENAMFIYSLSKKDLELKVLAVFNKDLLPFRLFQFGNISLVEHTGYKNSFFINVVGSKQHSFYNSYISLDD